MGVIQDKRCFDAGLFDVGERFIDGAFVHQRAALGGNSDIAADRIGSQT